MDVTLYKNFSVPKATPKNVTVVATYPGIQLVEPTGDATVSIRMTVPTDTLKWDNVNYFMWDGAYYFLLEVEKQANSISVIHGKMDVLTTYPDAIKQLRVLAALSSSHGSTRIADERRTMTVDATKTIVTFPNSIPDTEATGCYVAVTAQSGYTT